ncbi:MAG: phenylacetate-CoA oxygenase subunit PaaJ [Flavobacteriales bacterium]|nr:phenylacetate-CoA oxygenase subunit PaaJ [Flavobacteriales bacterium]
MAISKEAIYKTLSTVVDPEIPVITIEELGILKNVEIEGDKVIVFITPTYSGCPAMNMIELEMRTALLAEGIQKFEIKTVLFPPWTTDWISDSGLQKMKAFGIAPPEKTSRSKRVLFGETINVECPQCGSTNTEMVSRFGSTACKAMYRCLDCKEPFDYFKCL